MSKYHQTASGVWKPCGASVMECKFENLELAEIKAKYPNALIKERHGFVGGRQTHGFDLEEKVILEQNLLRSREVTLPNGSTVTEKAGGSAKWDAFSQSGIPVSIKNQVSGLAMFGDWGRQSKVDEDFYLYISWHDRGSATEIGRLMMLIPHQAWTFHFPKHYEAKIQELFEGVEGTYDYDETWTQRYKTFKDGYETERAEHGWLIDFQAKRGHLKKGEPTFQLRMQCAMKERNLRELAKKYQVKSFT